MSQPVRRPPAGHHVCPRRGCTAHVPDVMYACRRDWLALPNDVRQMISGTARLSVLAPRRRAAFRAADSAWESLDSPPA